MRRANKSPVQAILLIWLIAALVLPALGWAAQRRGAKAPENRMSAMGHLAARALAAIRASGGRNIVLKTGDGCDNAADCGDDGDGPAGGQAETSIAVDTTGQHIVVGFNDTRGFALNPVSVSGFAYSDDGGQTFVDGGQLPVTVPITTIGATKFPRNQGDPDVRYLGGCNFVYSEIILTKFSATAAAQTLGVHRSTDCGHTWTGPYEIPSATNPNGLLSGGAPADAADKEFIDADPDTGRVLLTWSNFTPVAPGGVEISATYSDNILTATPPTWSTRKVIAAAAEDGQSSQPRFAGNGSNNAYAVWRRFPFPGTFFGNGNTIGFVKSIDNGATWSAPVDLSAEFFTMDQVLGNDRVNTSPSIAVDNSQTSHAGNIYVVYANNNNHDGADVVFQKSTNGGSTFSSSILLNSRPGNDRAQWFPWVTVDTSTGRVWVFYYDQGIAANGDRSEVTVTFSDDAGAHWSPPVPLTDRPFHAGWGNDTGQPNLGDYNEAVAQNGELFAEFAVAFRPALGFVDGEPTSASMNTPDIAFRRVAEDDNNNSGGAFASRPIDTIPVSLGTVTATDSGGNGLIGPGETVQITMTLFNYDTNPLSSGGIHGVTGSLSTTTPGVTVTQDQSPFSNMNPGGTSTNTNAFVLQIAPSFVPGTPIELALTVRSSQHGWAQLLTTLNTGTPVPTTIFSENFDSVVAPALPAGWTTSHAGGTGVVPWTTSNTFCGTGSNGIFHTNNNTGTRFERLFSPLISVPAGIDYVTLDFDVCYDTEDDPNFNILAYDGFLLRITDQTAGHLLRSEQLEAFADEFTTGSFENYPKHFPRSGNASYFQDMVAWAGFSNGVKHVHLKLPGMAGTTVQLRWEYTQDSFGICSDVRPGHTCGVLVDNIVMKSVVSAP